MFRITAQWDDAVGPVEGVHIWGVGSAPSSALPHVWHMRITFGNPPNRHDVRRPLRTYVVVGYPRALRAGDPVTVVGTVRALNRAAAGPLALALARRRGRPTRPPTLTPGWAVG
jgi:hypothetical protein